MFNYEPEVQQFHLMQDLADHLGDFRAVDNALIVLIEWGFVDADAGAEFIKQLEEENN